MALGWLLRLYSRCPVRGAASTHGLRVEIAKRVGLQPAASLGRWDADKTKPSGWGGFGVSGGWYQC